MTTKESVKLQTPFDYLNNWSDGVHCWQAIQRLQSRPIISAASARSIGQNGAIELIAHARKHSALYADHYASVTPGSPLQDYPAISRDTLMGNFDRWATDPRINRESVDRFISTTDTIGERYLGDYLVWTSSGTSGEPGIYIQDRQALSIYQSLLTVRYQQDSREPTFQGPWHMAFDTSRLAMIAALEGHFAGVVFWEWSSKLNPWLSNRTRTFSILQPLPVLVEQLNEWQPSLLSSYPSMLAVLANEQRCGRLKLSPKSLWCGGEHLDRHQRQQMESAFGCPLIEDYGASEAMNMAFGCSHGKLHVNSDWFILEPVDENMQPVPAGQKSATTLVTNLANRLQPLIRYDIGDSVTVHTDACDCGNPLPTLSVDGRSDDTLWLPAEEDQKIPVLPLALNTIIEEHAGEFGFQINQCGPQELSIRTQGESVQSRSQAFDRIRGPLKQYFSSLGTLPITLLHDERPPERDACSGKLSQVNKLPELLSL